MFQLLSAGLAVQWVSCFLRRGLGGQSLKIASRSQRPRRYTEELGIPYSLPPLSPNAPTMPDPELSPENMACLGFRFRV